MSDITLKSLIQEHIERIILLKFQPDPPGFGDSLTIIMKTLRTIKNGSQRQSDSLLLIIPVINMLMNLK